MPRFELGENGAHISWAGTSYVLGVLGQGHLVHGYFGPELARADLTHLVRPVGVSYLPSLPIDREELAAFARLWGPLPGSVAGAAMPRPVYSPDLLPLEFPGFGAGPLRIPACLIRAEDGTFATRFVFREQRLVDGAPGPEGLPWVREIPGAVAARTLQVDLVDECTGALVTLSYVPVPGIPVLLRWARITNTGTKAFQVEQMCSASFDLPGAELDLVTLNGSWARERTIHRRPLAPGLQQVESRDGSSSREHSPWIALCEPRAGERDGNVWSLSLMYSGNHVHRVEVDPHGSARVQAGINPFAFAATIAPGDTFDTPAAALTFSADGFGGLSANYHRFVREALLPPRWRDRDRPVVINSWEAYYFDVTPAKLVDLARLGAEVGAELLVLDDGWFKGRHDDTTSLGDWTPDPGKFPEGLGPVADAVGGAGLAFGIWIEPEMVSPDSDLYRAHPDWVLSVPGRPSTQARNQLVLDMANPEVVEYLFGVFSDLLSSANITYVKWDMNRKMSEVGSPSTGDQGTVAHRYMLGVYSLLGRLTERFPEVLFEGCAGGGGRFDLGMLAYTPQYWTSDQTDAVERQRIQRGTTLFAPPETIGAHVSAVPNHQVGRVTPALTRGLTAVGFNFGFELDLAGENAEDRKVYAGISALYKRHRALFRRGRFYRYLPEDVAGESVAAGVPRPVAGGGRCAWGFVAPDKGSALVFAFQAVAGANSDGGFVRVWGLDESAVYRDVERDMPFDPVFLRERGFWIPPSAGDYQARYWILEREE